MHKEILNDEQLGLLGLVSKFKQDFYLVGGTAMALLIGHRRSIDFDLFSSKPIDKEKISRTIRSNDFKIEAVLVDNKDEYTVVVNGVKITFLYYPFNIAVSGKLEDYLEMPNLLTLASMKAYTLGRRGKWKDYVDMYFIFKDHYSLEDVVDRSKKIFKGEFNEKLFREQLCYFDDVDFSEQIEFVRKDVDDEDIREFLCKVALL